jgi:serine/threonine protein kinase/tetratricopeptide (TPR) repeat protein
MEESLKHSALILHYDLDHPWPAMPGRPGWIARYRILRTLGAGGMGVVYAAFDDQLEREIAVKTIPLEGSDDRSRERFLLEARTAASLNHPNVCQVYEVGEEHGRGFLAMELLAGEPLSARLTRGPLEASEAVSVTLELLSALGALHGRGMTHRDVKPSNVFLTPHGVKLLDFGLASRAMPIADTEATALTLRGVLAGTPYYMAPEQTRGDAADARTDLFAVALVLFEMLTGHKAFDRDSIVGVLHAIAFDPTPPIAGPPPAARLAPIVQRGLAKSAADRYQSAAAMADALTASANINDAPVASPSITRLIVLPFRILRTDPDTDFLAFSLPDAVTTTLSGVKSLAVRSSLTAARFTAVANLRQLARDAEVDVVLTGTFLKAGDRLRVTTQLVEVPAETVIWSDTADVAVGDVFRLQDELTRRIVDSLALPLTPDERVQLRRDAPSNPKAYEHYLRGNQLTQGSAWREARDAYLQSLGADDQYAPAWAGLGRVYRLMIKYSAEPGDATLSGAEDALHHAVALNPDLPLAHLVYAQIDVDRGRAQHAMVRMIGRARCVADARIFAALVHTCRYCGLVEASLAAHTHAVRLDPTLETSVMHTYFLLRRYEDVIAVSTLVQAYVFVLSIASLGRAAEALEWIRRLEASGGGNRVPALVSAARLLIEGRGGEGVDTLLAFAASVRDPEAEYYAARHLAHIGASAAAMPILQRAVAGGYLCYPAMASDPWLDSLRARPEFHDVLARARAGCDAAAAAFVAAGGPTLLGVTPAP